MTASDHAKLTLPQRKLLIELEHVQSMYIHPDYRPLATLLRNGLIKRLGGYLASRWTITDAGREWLRKWRGTPWPS